MWIFWKKHSCTFNKWKEKLKTTKYSWQWMFIFQVQTILLSFFHWLAKSLNSTHGRTSTDLSVVNLFSLTHITGTSFKRTTPTKSSKSFRRRHFKLFTKAELHVQAPHYSWIDQDVISGHHLQHIRWIPNTMALEQAHQNSETAWLWKKNHARPCNVKTSQGGPEFLPTFRGFAKCSFEKLRSRVNLSCQVCHISPCPPRSNRARTICALRGYAAWGSGQGHSERFVWWRVNRQTKVRTIKMRARAYARTRAHTGSLD